MSSAPIGSRQRPLILTRRPLGVRAAVNCICQNGPQRPGMQEVLNSLESHTVCTGTQCFEGEEDAFGLTAAPNGQPANNANFFMFMMCAASQASPPQGSREAALRVRNLGIGRTSPVTHAPPLRPRRPHTPFRLRLLAPPLGRQCSGCAGRNL